MSLNHLSKLAVQDQTATANVVIFDNVMEGVDGASTFGYTTEQEAVQVEDNQTRQYATMHTLDIRALELSAADEAKLDAIITNQRKVKVAGYGIDGYLQFSGESQFAYNKQYSDLIVGQILVTGKSTRGFVSSEQPFYFGRNMLDVFDIQNNNGTRLHGIVIEAGLSASISSGNQVITRSTASSTICKSLRILFPFPEKRISVGFNLISASVGTKSYGLRCLDSSNSIISTQTATFTGTTANAYSSTFTTAAGTSSIEFFVAPDSNIADEIIFNSPSLEVVG